MSAAKRRRASPGTGRRASAKTVRRVTATPASPSSGAAGGAVRLPRRSKGRRPEFYDDPAIDQLFAIVTALAAEISVAFDRMDTLERVLVRRAALSPAALESYEPDARATQQRAQRRDALLQRVFAVFDAYPQKTSGGR
jgi:hypothetical protein